MLPKWHPEKDADLGAGRARGGTPLSRMYENPVNFLKSILAVIGILLLVDKSANFYVWSESDRLSVMPKINTNPLHPLDQALVHVKNNTGHGIHGGVTGTKAIIVASTTKEDTSWIYEHFPDWEINIYVVDDQHANLTLFRNRGREASVYLTYVLNHYYSLPDYMVFLHADRYQWHNEDPMYDGVNPVKNLRLEHVKEVGYTSLRCTWNPGCPTGVHPDADANDGTFGMRATYAKQFADFFPDEELPEVVGTPCCAQFAVTKETVLKRKTWELERIRQWLWDTSVSGGKSGRVLEYMWHILMGKPAVSCPDASECFCNTFGYCNLTCPSERRCQGRYHLPPWNTGIPKGWPLRGQGTNGYPKYGWWQKWYPEETWGLQYASVNLDHGSTIDGSADYTNDGTGPDLFDLETGEENLPENETDDDVGPDELDSAASTDVKEDQEADSPDELETGPNVLDLATSPDSQGDEEAGFPDEVQTAPDVLDLADNTVIQDEQEADLDIVDLTASTDSQEEPENNPDVLDLAANTDDQDEDLPVQDGLYSVTGTSSEDEQETDSLYDEGTIFGDTEAASIEPNTGTAPYETMSPSSTDLLDYDEDASLASHETTAPDDYAVGTLEDDKAVTAQEQEEKKEDDAESDLRDTEEVASPDELDEDTG